MDTQRIKIGASVGLLAVAAVHAVFLAMAMQTPKIVQDHWQPSRLTVDPTPIAPSFTATDLYRSHGTNFDELPIAKSSVAPSLPVNAAARDEIKHQLGRRYVPVYVQPQSTPNCIPCQPVVTPQPRPANPTVAPSPNPSPQPPSQPTTLKQDTRPQIALFVDDSPQSKTLLNWFATDPQLVELKSKCSYQIYTPDNALYQARFAKTVPVENFPAMLFLRSDGGHVHVAGGSFLPSTPNALYSDMRKSWELSKQTQERLVAIKTQVPQEWQVPIEWQTTDCPSGECVPEINDRPSVFPLLDRARPGGDSIEGFFRSNSFIAQAACVGLIALIVIVGIQKLR